MPWLDDWTKRIKLTLDGTKIDGDMTDVPVMIHIASGTGQTNEDTTGVFDELFDSDGISWGRDSVQVAVNIGAEGTYDTLHTQYPSVIKDVSDYKMWYSGSDGSNTRTLYTTSSGGEIWTDHQLVIDKGDEGTYDTVHAFDPSVIKDGSTYKMWYSGNNGVNWRIIYCTSVDGITWTNHQLVIDIGDEGTHDTTNAYYAAVIKDGSIYKMWYTGSDVSNNHRIIYCTSVDGITWTNHQLVIDIGDEGTHDTSHSYVAMVTKDGSTYKMWYTGNDGSYLGTIYTDSNDGISWSNHQLVVGRSFQGTYDTTHSYGVAVIKDVDTYKMWYSGHDGTNGRILHTTSNSGDNNRKKIAVATYSGSQCYVEIEGWDPYAESAHLWTKVPTLTPGTDEVLYLYYDSNQPDNTTYVGDTGDAPAINAWDSNFKSVWHMAQDPIGATLDSILSDNNGISVGSMTSSDLVDGKIGKALDFDGSDDYVYSAAASPTAFTFSGNFCVSCIAKIDIGSTNDLVFKSVSNNDWNSATNGDYCLIIGTDLRPIFYIKGATGNAGGSGQIITQGTYYQYDAIRVGNTITLYINGVQSGNTSTYAGTVGNNMQCAAAYNQTNLSAGNFDGIIDEIRVSNTDRSAAWIKSTYYSNWGDFITFGAPEGPASFLFNGYVNVSGYPAARTVYLYRRDTGVLVGHDTSHSGTGYFEVASPYSGLHFVNILPEIGDGFNLLSYDQIDPGA